MSEETITTIKEGPVPDIVSAAVQEMLSQSRNLGLTWSLRIATVDTTTPLIIIFDGDTNQVSAVSMIGSLAVNQRVYVLLIPPAGTFVVGTTSAINMSRLGATVGYTYAVAAGSIASPTPAAMAGPPAAAITKGYGSETRFRMQFTGTFFGVGGDAGASFYARETSSGETVQIGSLQAANGSNGTRQTVSGAALCALNQPARAYVWEGWWARTTGVGTLTTSTDDVWALTIDEILV